MSISKDTTHTSILNASVNVNVNITGFYFHNIREQSYTQYVTLSLNYSLTVKQDTKTLLSVKNGPCTTGTYRDLYPYCKIKTDGLILKKGNFSIEVNMAVQSHRAGYYYDRYVDSATGTLYVVNNVATINLADSFAGIVIGMDADYTSLLGLEYSLY
jgi:hypothetical protein